MLLHYYKKEIIVGSEEVGIRDCILDKAHPMEEVEFCSSKGLLEIKSDLLLFNK